MLINENELRSEFKKLQLDESYIKHIIDKVGLYSNKDAKELLEKLIEFTKENNLINSHSWSLYKLGRIYIHEENFTKADELFHKAYDYFQVNENDEGMLAVIIGFMGSKCMQNQYANAIKWAINGINLAEKTNDFERLILVKCNMAAIYMAIEEYKKAIEILDQIEDIPWIGSDDNKVAYYLNRSICEREIKNLDKALYYLEYIKDLAMKIPSYTINWILGLSKLYIEKEWYSKAEEKIFESISESNKINEYEYKNDAIICLSKIDISRGKYKEAIDKLKSIETKVEKDKVRRYMKDMYNIFRISYKELKDYENAYLYLEKYEKIESETRNIQSDTIISILDTQREEMSDKNYKLLYEKNKLIYKIGQNITANLNKNNIFRIIADEIKNILKYDIIQIGLYNEKDGKYQYQLVVADNEILNNSNNHIYEDSFAHYSISNKKDIIINEVENEYYHYIKDFEKYSQRIKDKYSYMDRKLAKSLMVVPMIIKDKVNGIICIQNYNKNSYDLKDLITLKILSTYIGIALENSDLYKKVKYNANYDALTGIFNRRKAIEDINKLRSSLKGCKENYYITMIDIDNFKKINDVYGHVIGDKVLFMVANTIKKSIEEDDIVGRYGGEEFIVIVKDGNCSFKSKVENIRKNIELLNIECSNEKYIKVTASIGVKRLDVNIKSLEENIALADQLLYKAKSTGKNKVVY